MQSKKQAFELLESIGRDNKVTPLSTPTGLDCFNVLDALYTAMAATSGIGLTPYQTVQGLQAIHDGKRQGSTATEVKLQKILDARD